jgi:hypothetical protein
MRHIVYVVGAGLTKALETTKRVPLMPDFVSVIADYIYEDNGKLDRVILTTLAELEIAGVFENTREDWKKLARRIELSDRDTEPDLTRGEAEAFKKIMQERPKENIESLLQRALQKARDDVGAGFLPQRFNFAINKLFSRIGSSLNRPILEQFLARQFELPDARHTFISFNYDLVLDSCVQTQGKLSWNVKSGYGFMVDRFITPQVAEEHMGQFDGPGGAFQMLLTSKLDCAVNADAPVTILKPHGSLNWLLGFKANYNFLDAVPILCLDAAHSITHYDRFNCKHLQLKDDIGWDPSEGSVWPDAGLYLIPPTDSKSSNLQVLRGIRDQERQAYSTADEVYVVGWSMPLTDRDQVEFIRKCMKERMRPLERVVAINYEARTAYYTDVARVFGVSDSRLVTHDTGFCRYVDASGS